MNLRRVANLVQDENGDLLAGSHNILNRWKNYFSQLLNVRRVRVTLRLTVYRQSVCLGDKPLETRPIFFFQLNTCGHSPYVTSSLMRQWVYCLQLLLVLASTVILRSEFCRTHEHILLSQIRESPNLEGQVPVFMCPRNRVALLYPQALGSLFIVSMTRRAMVEVFNPTSTQACTQGQ
jgi:hypothetical protein